MSQLEHIETLAQLMRENPELPVVWWSRDVGFGEQISNWNTRQITKVAIERIFAIKGCDIQFVVRPDAQITEQETEHKAIVVRLGSGT